MTDPRVDWDRIGRYLAGESSPDEAAAVRRWLEEHPSDARTIAVLDGVTRDMPPARAIDVEGALRRVKARRTVGRPSFTWSYVGLAAAAAIVLGLGITLWRRPSAAVRVRALATTPGVRDSVDLSDRAHVVLAPSSRIVASNDDVTLTGQAYFSVRHDARRPFTVHAGNVTVRDVGTRFGVEQDANGLVRVVVVDGSVDVAVGGSSARATAGDVAIVTDAGGGGGGRVELRRGAATPDDVAWTSGRLVFRDASLASVTWDLHRWYGVVVQVRDPALMSRHFTGTFDNQPVARVLDVLALALGARLDRSADTVFLGNSPPAR